MGRYVATLATAVLALGMTTGANAMTVGAPAALSTAIQDITMQEQVTCKWIWHPAWGWRCHYGYYYPYYGGYYGPGFYGGSRFFFGHRHHHHHRHGHRHGHHRR